MLAEGVYSGLMSMMASFPPGLRTRLTSRSILYRPALGASWNEGRDQHHAGVPVENRQRAVTRLLHHLLDADDRRDAERARQDRAVGVLTPMRGHDAAYVVAVEDTGVAAVPRFRPRHRRGTT